MSNFPCKSCIKNTNGGCCNILPIFNQDELAKVLYKHAESIEKKGLITNRYNGLDNVYIITPKLSDDVIKTGIDITDYQCPFLDMEKGCLIYEDRPYMCSGFGEKYGKCPYEGQETVEPTEHIKFEAGIDKNALLRVMSNYPNKDKSAKELSTKKALKIVSTKEFKHFLMAYTEMVDLLRNSDYLSKDFKYGFIKTQKGRFGPYEAVFMKEKYPINALQKGYNFLQRKITVINNDILLVIQEKLNKTLKGVAHIDVQSSPEYKLLFTTLYLEYFKDNFKGKIGEYGGLINSDELYALKKELFKRLGYDSMIQAAQDECISKIAKQVEIVFKQINQIK